MFLGDLAADEQYHEVFSVDDSINSAAHLGAQSDHARQGPCHSQVNEK